MLEKLKNAKKVVGTRRLVRAIQAGGVQEAYLAEDADLFILRQKGCLCTSECAHRIRGIHEGARCGVRR